MKTRLRSLIEEAGAKTTTAIQRDGIEAVRERVNAGFREALERLATARLDAGLQAVRLRPAKRDRPIGQPIRIRRTAPRQRGRREARHVATQTSSADPGESEPPAVDPWRWASEASWRSFVESIRAYDVERQIQRERDGGQAA
jgi:hypothetical protein